MKKSYEVSCPKCGGTDKKCHVCDGRGYNVVTFENGERIK
jgi:hypothetical protein